MDVITLKTVYTCLSTLLSGVAFWLVIGSLREWRRLSRTRAYAQGELCRRFTDDLLAIVSRNRKNGIDFFKSDYDRNRMNVAFISTEVGELEIIAYLYAERIFDEFYFFDMEEYEPSFRAYEFLHLILEKIGAVSRTDVFLRNLFSISKNKGTILETRDPEESLLALTTYCRTKNIGLIIKNMGSLRSQHLRRIASNLCKSSENVIAVERRESSFKADLASEGHIRRIMISPLDYFSFILYLGFNIRDLFYLGRNYSRVDFAKISCEDLTRRMIGETEEKLYLDYYDIINGKTSQASLLQPYTYTSQFSDSRRLTKKKNIYSEIYQKKYSFDLAKLDSKELSVLGFLSLIPFSIHSADIHDFCESRSISYGSVMEKLRKKELIYETRPYKYVNVCIEMKLLNDEFPDLFDAHFADRQESREGPTLVNDERQYVYTNCTGATPGLRMLIEEALRQRFHRAYGHYAIPIIKRLVSDHLLRSKEKAAIEDFARSYYSDLYTKNPSPSIFMAGALLRRMHETDGKCAGVFPEELVKACNAHEDMESVDYYSLLLGRRVKLKLSDRTFKQNLLFCYSHLMGHEFSMVRYPRDDGEEPIPDIEIIE